MFFFFIIEIESELKKEILESNPAPIQDEDTVQSAQESGVSQPSASSGDNEDIVDEISHGEAEIANDVEVEPARERTPDTILAASSNANRLDNVTSTPAEDNDAVQKQENDNVDSTCEGNTGNDSNSNGTRENNEVSSSYEAYADSIPDYSVDLKCAVSSCSTIDSFVTPESRHSVSIAKSQDTPVSDSSEVVSSQDGTRPVTDSKLDFYNVLLKLCNLSAYELFCYQMKPTKMRRRRKE